MPISARRSAPRAAALICSSLALCLAGLAAAPASQAATDTQYCGGVGSLQTCTWAKHTLVSVRVTGPSGTTMGAGASTNGREDGLYANYAWGTSKACHSYGAGNMLYPLIKNGTSYTYNYNGTSTYGSGAASC